MFVMVFVVETIRIFLDGSIVFVFIIADAVVLHQQNMKLPRMKLPKKTARGHAKIFQQT